ncbi:hypothetical protein KIH27_12230 [Mycobacterium sp. M1]|uniref:Uncharacterized protein n=1 Tax=Mycolicibacter acidiphilus TaxID=2835306 RepID=A0ABS5RJ76_9MYCO|nr:hypothetical protein [Mycolicibacter acidiphilus]MBS9534352.1 hypothetical protein [Mycolicibacter acidiphilus]
MSTTEQSFETTRRFARVIGPFLAVIAATAAVHAPRLFAQIADFGADPLWGWVAGSFTLIAGLTVVALHPYWRGAAAASVSVLGWLTVVKGFFLVAFPATLTSIPVGAADAVGVFRAVYLVFAAWGLWLAWVGWGPARSR